MSQSQIARCLSCRSDVSVPDSYADRDQINCGICGVQLRILRNGGVLRLVVADTIALKDSLRQIRVEIAETTRDLKKARASWGIGVNGLGIGVLYVVAKVALEEREFNQGLVVDAVVLSVLVGVLLEVVNYLFLAKRQNIARLSEHLQRIVAEQREIERKIKESSRR